MHPGPRDLAQVRLTNAMALFDEFVRLTARHADAATLRGLERRFAERLQIQPSYWSQIKGRSRQIGEHLARQFERLCHKPAGWMDQPHDGGVGVSPTRAAGVSGIAGADDERLPRDDDERFIVGLVLTYYRRHPQRARSQLLGLLGEVLVPTARVPEVAVAPTGPRTGAPTGLLKGAAPPARPPEDPTEIWRRSQDGVAPLKPKR